MKNLFLISVLMIGFLNLSAQKRIKSAPKNDKIKHEMSSTINCEIESSDDDTVVNWMIDPVGKKSGSIKGVDISNTYKTYSKKNNKEIFSTVKCPYCKKSTVYEKNGDHYILLGVNTRTKKVVRCGSSKIVKKDGRYSYEGNACCDKRQELTTNGVAHENIWESKM